MTSATEVRLVDAAGLVQGITLVAFPAASTILTSSSGYDLSNTRYGVMFLPQVVAAIAASLLGARLAQATSLKRVMLLGLRDKHVGCRRRRNHRPSTRSGTAWRLHHGHHHGWLVAFYATRFIAGRASADSTPRSTPRSTR
jgi:hypothetical protein